MSKEIHWADLAAENLIKIKDKDSYTCASGISPSGIVHIGNFREVITTALVVKALQDKGKKTRFIYSWDDYDVFRKVPANMPKQEILKEYLRKPIIDVPDTWGCHKSYAEHNEAEFEKDLPGVGIKVEFIQQSKMYRFCKYAEEMKIALKNREKIAKILNQYREEPLESNWYPLSIYCEKCNQDNTNITNYDEDFMVSYKCNDCSFEDTFDLRKKGISKLQWRVDWPMRWYYEDVDFEPGGKDHSTTGGSYSTAKEIVKEVWNKNAPYYVMYDFISVKGKGGKISSSKGNVITLKEALDIYEPEMVRWLFASTRPNTEFAISFDLDVINLYEEFDKCEKTYFGVLTIENKEKLKKEKRIYELSCIEIPKQLPIQIPFRHLTNLIQVDELNIEKTYKQFESEAKNEYDKKRLLTRITCTKNWIEKYAPEDFKFSIIEEPKINLNESQKAIVNAFITLLENHNLTDEELHKEFYTISEKHNIKAPEFFKLMYNIIVNKDRGPKLASFILTIGKTRVINILKKSTKQ